MMRAASRVSRTIGDLERAYYAETERVYGSWFASIYDAVAFPLRGLRTQVVQWVGIRPGMRAIDVATGTGAQARTFADAGAFVVGIDLSARMLAIARRRTRDRRVTYVRADATQLPDADASFDVACVSFALHEMPPRIRERALTELARVTRRGGTVVVVDYAMPQGQRWRTVVARVIGLFERDSYDEFLHYDLRAALERAGAAVREEHRAVLGIARVIVATRS